MKIVNPKTEISDIDPNAFSIFLAGGMGKDWRKDLIKKLEEMKLDIVIIDPTVEDWKNDVGDEVASNPKFVRQVSWEHQGLQASKVQVYHFDETSLAPITLFETGRFLSDNGIVMVEDGYEKAGYVEVAAHMYGQSVVRTIEELANFISIKYHTRM